MTETPATLPGTVAIVEAYRSRIVSGELDAMPAEQRRETLLPLFTAMIDATTAPAEMQTLVGRALCRGDN